MESAKPYLIYPAFAFVSYPNRDSTPFREYYNIPEAKTIIRGTLRYQVMHIFIYLKEYVVCEIGIISI